MMILKRDVSKIYVSKIHALSVRWQLIDKLQSDYIDDDDDDDDDNDKRCDTLILIVL